jgi:hypothetical protein
MPDKINIEDRIIYSSDMDMDPIIIEVLRKI